MPITAAQMKAYDTHTIEVMGVPSLVLMERAALAVVDALCAAAFDLAHCLCVCGTGNNGGDGMAVARLLHLAGHKTQILLVGDEAQLSSDAQTQLAIACNYGVPFERIDSTSAPIDDSVTTLIDALFGIGLSRKVTGVYRHAIEAVNLWRLVGLPQRRTLAVDVPSGIHADTGEILDCAVKADLTVTFAFSKIGLVTEPGATHAGRVVVADIGIYRPSASALIT